LRYGVEYFTILRRSTVGEGSVPLEFTGRKIAAILAADVVGYSRLTGADEEGTLRLLRTVRAELIDPSIAANRGRIVKTTGDGVLVEFASVVDAVRTAIDVQRGMVVRNTASAPEKRMEFRIGIHLGDVVVESDGDLMGDAVNIAARLEGIADPGGICLSEDAYRLVRDRTTEEFVDLGDKTLKNIARPMRVYGIVGSGSRREAAVAPTVENPKSARPGPPRLSLVVLPFANIGGDAEQEYLVDGITESLTTDLARLSGAFVIARSTAFTYKGKRVDVKQIGRELNVRYVLEGSVQRGGSRMRVNVQLSDAETGNHLWAERFDKPLADLFDMHDEILGRLASQLGTQLIAIESGRAERAINSDFMDLYFQGMACLNKGSTFDHMAQACGFFERALTLDPGNVEALVGVATANARSGSVVFTEERAVRLAAAEASLTKALSLAPDHASAHLCMGYVQLHTDRATQCIAECERALALDRNRADAHGVIGFAKYYAGRGEEAEAHILEALRLSPRDKNAYVWMTWVGIAKLGIGADEEAVAWLRRAIETNRNLPPATHCYLAAALTRLGRLDEAQSALHLGLALDPNFTVLRFRARAPSNNPTFLAQREGIAESMRKAGVPEA
jgi:TolB-like protein/class 3 adenylate cyclase